MFSGNKVIMFKRKVSVFLLHRSKYCNSDYGFHCHHPDSSMNIKSFIIRKAGALCPYIWTCRTQSEQRCAFHRILLFFPIVQYGLGNGLLPYSEARYFLKQWFPRMRKFNQFVINFCQVNAFENNASIISRMFHISPRYLYCAGVRLSNAKLNNKAVANKTSHVKFMQSKTDWR